MSEIIPLNSIQNSSISSSRITDRTLTKPTSFEEFLSGAASNAGDFLSGGLSAAGGLGLSGDLFGLIEMQRQLQIEMETVSMISNIDKSRHESKMAAIRNIRTS